MDNFRTLARLTAFVAVLAAIPLEKAIAQETTPGTSCAGLNAGTFRHSSGPHPMGLGHMLVCDGTNWLNVLTYSENGDLTQLGNQTCVNGDVLRFSSSATWQCASAIDTGSSLWEPSGDAVRLSSGSRLQWGFNSVASGGGSTAWGDSSLASDGYSTAWGFSSLASGYYSTAWGSSQASGSVSTAWGDTSTASGDTSTAWGVGAHAGSYAETSLGRYPLSTSGTAGSWVGTDVLLEIGNGTTSGERANALTLLKNGNLAIGNITPDVRLDVDGDIQYTGTLQDMSDARLKTDILSLTEESASGVYDLRPVSFRMNGGEGDIEYGFVAQEVMEVFPSLVSQGGDGMLSLNYIGLIAPLVQTVQSLQDENATLQESLAAIEIRLSRIEGAPE